MNANEDTDERFGCIFVNLSFFAAWPMWAASIALFALRGEDNLLTFSPKRLMPLYAAEQIQSLIERNVGVAVAPAFNVITVGEDYVELRMRYVEGMTRLGDTLSGPVLMTAADAAMYAALIAFVPDGEYAVTSHINIDFLRRPAACDVRARGRLLRCGRRSVNCVVELFSGDDDRLVAHVTGAYARMPGAYPNNSGPR